MIHMQVFCFKDFAILCHTLRFRQSLPGSLSQAKSLTCRNLHASALFAGFYVFAAWLSKRAGYHVSRLMLLSCTVAGTYRQVFCLQDFTIFAVPAPSAEQAIV
jgi:hypothetical protein